MTNADERPIRDQLVQAVRDLWTMPMESGDNYIVFMDRRRLSTRVERASSGRYRISWEPAEGQGEEWIKHEREYENLREAAFHAYQGPH